jgi:hypothetical protein
MIGMSVPSSRDALKNEVGIADRLILSEIANRLELHVDQKDWAALRSMLCDVVVVDFGTEDTSGGVSRLADRVVADLADGHPDAEVTYHARMSDIININGDVATLEGLQYAWSISADEEQRLYEVWGRMSYSFKKENGDWRVTSLKSAKLRDKHMPGRPAGRAG